MASSTCCISLGTLVWRPTICVLVQHHLWKSIYSTSGHVDKTPPSSRGCSCSMSQPARALCLPPCSNLPALKCGRCSPGMCMTRNQRRNKNTRDRSALCFSTAKFHSGLCFGVVFFFFPRRKRILIKTEFLIKATKQNLFLLKTSKLKNLVLGKSCFSGWLHLISYILSMMLTFIRLNLRNRSQQ